MKRFAQFVAYLMIGCLSLSTTVGPAPVAQAQETAPPQWREPYTGAAATGEDVVALWHFDESDPMEDASGRGHTLTLRGESRLTAEGRFAGGLESFKGYPPDDEPNGAKTPDAPELTPEGAFTLELWFKPKPEMAEQARSFLIDKKYFHYAKEHPAANHDYLLLLKQAGEGEYVLQAHLGFGEGSETYNSRQVALAAGQWYHAAFTYDGAGQGTLYLNGEQIGRRRAEGRGSVSDGPHPLVIGSRVGSHYHGCAAFIDEVRISRVARPFMANRVTLSMDRSRTAFQRMEQEATVSFTVTNDRAQPLEDTAVEITAEGLPAQRVDLPDLEAGEAYTFEYAIDTSLRPGSYMLAAEVVGFEQRDEASESAVQINMPVVITARPMPRRMPVVMWGGGHVDKLQEIGFTHNLVNLSDYRRVWEAEESEEPTAAQDPSRVADNRQKLDEYLAKGFKALVYTYPSRWAGDHLEQYQRVDREGRTIADNVCGRFAAVQDFCYRMGAAITRTYGDLPALDGALIASETRGGTQICYHDHDLAAFRESAGFDIPDTVGSKNGVLYRNLSDFPTDRVISDDHPLLVFYRWFWQQGDGWNLLHTKVSQGLKSAGREDLWTFYDPAVRVPSTYGSGGEVDVLSQWTYSYPDPLKIGLATDELFAMTNGRPGQGVMKMTQVIWYRSQTAPMPGEGEDPSEHQASWEKEKPEAKFITIAPDHLSEALWLKLARPIRGIMYHGVGSLIPGDNHGSYVFTNAETKEVLRRLIHEVVQPFGPTLLQVPDPETDVAFLESFSSQMLAGRGAYGWGGNWGADAYMVLRWAHLQPRILYEQTLLDEGLDQYKVLVLAHCDVLPQSVAEAIQAFQDRGGIIVGDEYLAPVIQPDILLPSYDRTDNAQQDKAALQDRAAKLRQQLDSHYQRPSDSSNPDVLTRVRRFGTTDYLFAINDHRAFGDYVGQHGRVMEKGRPAQATLTLNRSAGFVYDLTASQAMDKLNRSGDRIQFDIQLEPGQGRLFMVTDRPIETVRIEAPQTAKLGESLTLNLQVLNDRSEPIDAVAPLRVDILDPQGRPAEFSGFYGAANGQVAIPIDLAPNDLTGQWQIRVRDLASEQTSTHALEVTEQAI